MSRMRVIIYLMRNDLRYIDNEALCWAHNNADHVLPLYCFDPRHFQGTHQFDFPKTGPHRLRFLLQAVQNVRDTLLKHGSNLVVRRGCPEEVIPQLVQSLGPDCSLAGLAYQEEVTKEELDVEAAMKKVVGDAKVQTFWGSTLYHKGDLPFPTKQVPDIYTEFRKQVERHNRVRKLIDMPKQLKPLPPGVELGDVPSMQDFGMEEREPDVRTAFPFAGGETAAQQRLHDYLWNTDNVATYKDTRNGMIGADYSTKFSPWLALGCLSPRQIYWEDKRYESERVANSSTYWVIFELLWRDYFKFVALKYGNRLFYKSGLMGKHIEWKQDPKLFAAWKEGRTGVPYVDANMREMAATGFMSNRGRQNVASFLTKDLKLDWRLGAEWFESQLIDHDVCSNYGNWLYSAGIGNDPRQDRKFNMVKQGLDYDANGDYVRLWVSELKDMRGGGTHTPWVLGAGELSRAGVSLGENYPHPVVMAPEWGRHTGKVKGSAGGRGGRGGRGGPGSAGSSSKRGMDFYFKNSTGGHRS